jgi:hypothetical protein
MALRPTWSPLDDDPLAGVFEHRRAAEARWPEPVVAAGGAQRHLQVLRRVDLWSVLKVSLVVYVALFAVAIAAVAGVWAVGRESGLIGNFEEFMVDLGFRDFRLLDGELLRTTLLVGPLLVVLASLGTVVATAVVNVALRLMGGVEVTVTDEFVG